MTRRISGSLPDDIAGVDIERDDRQVDAGRETVARCVREQRAGLHERLAEEHSRHDRSSGEMAGEERLVDRDAFAGKQAHAVLDARLFAQAGVRTTPLGVTAGEASNPKKVLPKAINTVPWRIGLFYVGALLIILSVVSWTAFENVCPRSRETATMILLPPDAPLKVVHIA